MSILLAACASAPKPTQPVAPLPVERARDGLVGMTADELVRRFGTPALQVREGTSLKLQFRSPQCVLDAYLYPTGSAPLRVTYVDARTPSLGDIDPALCIASLPAL